MDSRRVVTLAVALAASVVAVVPAQACHLFKRWHYPWPQRCYVARVIPRPVVITRPGMPLRVPPIKVPTLEDIDWGYKGDDRWIGLAKLREVQETR